jgi:hypothetical protein
VEQKRAHTSTARAFGAQQMGPAPQSVDPAEGFDIAGAGAANWADRKNWLGC